MREKNLTSKGASSKERTRASTKALKDAGGARKTFRFTPEMVRDLKAAKKLAHAPRYDVQVIAWALRRLLDRRKDPHHRRPGDRRALGKRDRRQSATG